MVWEFVMFSSPCPNRSIRVQPVLVRESLILGWCNWTKIRVRVNYFTCPSMLKPEIHQTRFPSSNQLSGKPPVSPYSFYPNVRLCNRNLITILKSNFSKGIQSLQKWKSVSLCALVSTMNKLTNQRARRSAKPWVINKMSHLTTFVREKVCMR